MPTFRHDAVFYAGGDGFLDALLPFIREGVRAGEPVLVVVRAPKIDRLRSGLGALADQVGFEDMGEVGRNPARIIPAWRDFVDAHAGTGVRLRGIGEPIDGLRTPDELVECHRHEALLDVALADRPALTLLCPYDTASLPADVLADARRTHGSTPVDETLAHFDGPLSPPPAGCTIEPFDEATSLPELRHALAGRAAAAGFDDHRTGDLLLAVTELIANAMQHGDGTGVLRSWTEGGTVVADVTGGYPVADQMVGRARPASEVAGGRGLWLVNQLCDLSQIRSSPSGTQVRVRLAAA